MLLEIVKSLRRDDPVDTVENILVWLRTRLTYVPNSTFTSAEDILDQRGRLLWLGCRLHRYVVLRVCLLAWWMC